MTVSMSLLTAPQEDIDAAQRLSDIVNSLVVTYPIDEIINSWIAVRLSDGGTDGTLYDSRRNAVAHQVYEYQCAYICLRAAPGGMPLREAFTFLQFNRATYEAGFRMTDPDAPNGGRDMYMPLPKEDVMNQIRRMQTNTYRRMKGN